MQNFSVRSYTNIVIEVQGFTFCVVRFAFALEAIDSMLKKVKRVQTNYKSKYFNRV